MSGGCVAWVMTVDPGTTEFAVSSLGWTQGLRSKERLDVRARNGDRRCGLGADCQFGQQVPRLSCC
jgi:hypothetical protein